MAETTSELLSPRPCALPHLGTQSFAAQLGEHREHHQEMGDGPASQGQLPLQVSHVFPIIKLFSFALRCHIDQQKQSCNYSAVLNTRANAANKV